MSHTPTPWEVWTSNSHTRITARFGQDGGVVSATSAADGMAVLRIKPEDAKFIVRACNAHEALVAAVEAVIEYADDGKASFSSYFDFVKKCRIALAAAGAA
jgi:hypothetical protein